jgi:mercuric ion transport protein
MKIKDDPRPAPTTSGEQFLAVGGLLGALAASSCCILPLVLFSLGVSGAWIGHLTRLAPYQPYILAATVACLGYGYWRVYRAPSCAKGEACAAPLPNRFVNAGLIVATVLVIAALGLDFLAPLFVDL